MSSTSLALNSGVNCRRFAMPIRPPTEPPLHYAPVQSSGALQTPSAVRDDDSGGRLSHREKIAQVIFSRFPSLTLAIFQVRKWRASQVQRGMCPGSRLAHTEAAMSTVTDRSRSRFSQKQLRQRLRTVRRQRATKPGSHGDGSNGFTSNFRARCAPSSIPSSPRSRGRSIADSSSWPWPQSLPWAAAPSPTCSASWTPWPLGIPAAITASSPVTDGHSRLWHDATFP